MRRTRAFWLAASTAVACLVAAGCGSPGTPSAAGSGSTGSTRATGSSSGTKPVPNRMQPIPNTTGKKVKIALISFPSSNEFFAPVAHGSNMANAVLSNGYNASVDYLTVNTFTEDAVNAAARTALLQGYNAIGFVPLDAGVCPVLKQAVAQGMKVATFITSAPCAQSSGALFFHGEDLYNAWKDLAVPALVRAIRVDPYWSGKSCKVGVITGAFNVPTHELMRTGILAGLKGISGISAVSAGVQANNDLSQVGPAARAYVAGDPNDLCGIVVDIGDAGAAAAALTAAQAKHIKVMSADLTVGGVAQMRAGKQAVLIGQDPFGESYDTAMMLYDAVVSGKNPSFYEPVKDSVMTPGNISSLLAAQASGQVPK